MSAAVMAPQKRALGETNGSYNIHRSPQSAKKRKLNGTIPSVSFESKSPIKSFQNASQSFGKRIGSSQPKSQFETEVLEKMTQDINDLKESNAEKDQQWERPAMKEFDPRNNVLRFQNIDCEVGTLNGDKATVKMFGVSEEGYSIALHVTDFLHYLYVAAPINFQKSDVDMYKKYLETVMANNEPTIHSVQMVLRENIFGFQGNQKSPYLKITVTDPKYIASLRTKIERSEANYKNLWKGADGGILTFDMIEYVLRFMIDTGVEGMSWAEVPAGKYNVLPAHSRQSNCQIEASCHYRDLVALGHEGEWAKMAPLRILSFDIECAGRKGIFPEPNMDPVIQIGNVVTRYGETKPFVRNVFVLDTCSSIVNTQVYSHKSEEELLMNWRDFLEKVDPDVIIGYNIASFDFPYLLDRAKHLKLTKFPYWSRLRTMQSKHRDANFSSKQTGSRESQETNTNGRIQLDLLQLIQRDHHLRSYTLNSVCAHFLGEQKEDVQHTMITELHNGTADSRRRLAVYCLKDAYLPQRLMDKLMCLVNYSEMARVTGVPFKFLLARGQQVKFVSQLFRKALSQQLVVPNLKNDQQGEEAYEGATVIEPNRGYYKIPVATLDFASLYPSIIQAHNLCYTTLLNKASVDKLNLVKDEDYIVTPNGDLFCTAKIRKGLLTQILEELLGARKRAKKELAVETDPFKKAVLNGRQLALKISANSVYGLTGATVGKLPCLAIASSTTSYGRQMIERTKVEVEAKYNIANGYTHDAEVIYGDTDSVMVKFGSDDLKEVMRLGEEAASYVSSKFIKPIKLEFEKVYYPYLLINKKRYAGLYWTNSDKYDKMDTKGLETVRRDNCRLVQVVTETVLRKILIDRDEEAAQAYVQDTIAQLLQNKVDLSMLVITKAYTKHEYAAKQAHVELAERMKKRGGTTASLGDRIAYVIVKGSADSKNYEKSEDPIYVLENNIPIDMKYYLDNQLAKPLERIFEPILGEKKTRSLLQGDHTRTVSMAASGVGGLMKFAKKTQTCMGCKKPLVNKEEVNGAVCANCRPRIGELYTRQVKRVGELEVRFGRLWTQCQRCQGSMHTEVLCESRDCPIFYMRTKARKEVESETKELARFDEDIGAIW